MDWRDDDGIGTDYGNQQRNRFGSGIGFCTCRAQSPSDHAPPVEIPELARRAVEEKLPIMVTTMDVDRDESVRDTIAAIEQEHGPIDVLVNNAGVERAGAIEELPLAEFRAVMETNYFGVLRCVQAVVPQMRKRRSGCIINVSSVAGRIQSPVNCIYRVEVGAGSAKRSIGCRNEDVWCARGDCRARHY